MFGYNLHDDRKCFQVIHISSLKIIPLKIHISLNSIHLSTEDGIRYNE